MGMPSAWIDRIFDKLTLTYGQAFLNRWKDLDLNAVKSDWMHELDGMERHPEAIAFALSNLNDKPPTVIEFRAMCRRAPSPVVPALEAPKADPERVRAELAKLAPVRQAARVNVPGGRDWAHRILARSAAGERILPITLRFATEAVRGAA